MTGILLSYLAIFLPVLAAGILAGWIACLLWTNWRDWRPIGLVPTDTGIDALAQAVTCHWCRDKPKGRCTCGVWCGHQQCPRLTRADMDYLDNGTEMPR